MNEVIRITYNWYATSNADYPEQYGEYIKGLNGVSRIHEHEAKGDGDRWYYDVYFNDSSFVRIFNPNIVCYHPINQ